jgi:hypothetical protein
LFEHVASKQFTTVFEIMQFDEECLNEISFSLLRNGIPEAVGSLILAMAQPRALSSIEKIADVNQYLAKPVETFKLPNLHQDATEKEKEALNEVWKLFEEAENDFHAFFQPRQERQRIRGGSVLKHGAISPSGPISQRLKNGQAVIIHCFGGKGRTGTIMGALLISLAGCRKVSEALKVIRARRPGDVMNTTDEIEKDLADLQKSMANVLHYVTPQKFEQVPRR